MDINKTVDATGMLCPMPILRTVQAVKEMKFGEVLEITATDPGIKPDIKNWCEMMGHELIDIQDKDGRIIVHLKKLK
ncbi:MAG: sulfurtransferase TusA family protein [Deltaproteobacteria bacterium]|nr:sulfurtransferase TusA family protein [Deltaproteobacteria bacterium]MCL5277577.1 sulfurtransferase TusA family protein [Deltaproteobacteria bacterium]